MGRAAKNLHRQLIKGTPTDYSKMPVAKTDATNVMNRKQRDDSDDKMVARADSSAADPFNKPDNDLYVDVEAAKERKKGRTVLGTMDKHGVEDIVRNLSK